MVKLKASQIETVTVSSGSADAGKIPSLSETGGLDASIGGGGGGGGGAGILSGSGAPDAGLGTEGAFYIDTTASALYGPKTSGSWGTPTNLIGAAGADGADGAAGADGADGKTILNGAGAPSNGLGVDGDFYIDTVASALYGPKAGGVWGSATSLIGPQGTAGADGADGADGSFPNWDLISDAAWDVL